MHDLSKKVFNIRDEIEFIYQQNQQYKTDISSARLTILNAISSLNASEQTYKTSLVALKKTQDQLALKKIGGTTNEIATKLFVSSRTIETHRATILKKLEVKNTAELIKRAAEMNTSLLMLLLNSPRRRK